MISVICDASPLILLAKIDQLELIAAVSGGQVFVLQAIVDEVLTDSADDAELVRLRHFLQDVTIVDYTNDDYPSSSLSRNDRSVLNWAIENKADWIIADERLLRRIAIEEKISVLGVFGLLVGAVKDGLRKKEDARVMVDDLVGKYGCRISIALYQRIVKELEKM